MTKAEMRTSINYKFLMMKLSACKTKAGMRKILKEHFDSIANA